MINFTSSFWLLAILLFSCSPDQSKKKTADDRSFINQTIRDTMPQLKPSTVDTIDGIIHASTGEGLFEESDPWLHPPGTNLLANVYTNAYDSEGNEMVNTLPSTPTVPYNLHHGEPKVEPINITSPTDDLQAIFDFLIYGASRSSKYQMLERIQFGIDILEGRPINDTIGYNCYNIYGGKCRNYSGFPLLHYNGPEKVRKVTRLAKPDIQNGDTILYNVDVRQLWYDSHIESNTGMLDLSEIVKKDVPWTITYSLDVLNRGEDDFSPFAMFLDFNKKTGEKQPHIGMDQSFFPMSEGTRTILKIKMPPAKYYNLVYTWGWRMHPPRIQVMEDKDKEFPDPGNNNVKKSLHDFEVDVFGPNPTQNQATREAAIAKISELSPAKRMWNAFRSAKQAVLNNDYTAAAIQYEKGRDAFIAWKDRTHLPDTSLMDRSADLTLLYVNNTIYGGFTDGGIIDYPKWRTRGDSIRITLMNGDYFWHGYQNVDFGGARGWENQFKSSVKVGGSGCWFTFGRAYWWKNLGKEFVRLPPAENGSTTPSVQKLHLTWNYEPSRRLRFYQFDPFHHDVGILSIH